MKFRVGDRVKVFSRDQLPKYERRDGGYFVDGLHFHDDMKEFCGQSFYIETLQSDNQYNLAGVTYITYTGKQRFWRFNESMLTLIDSRLCEKLVMDQEFDKELL